MIRRAVAVLALSVMLAAPSLAADGQRRANALVQDLLELAAGDLVAERGLHRLEVGDEGAGDRDTQHVKVGGDRLDPRRPARRRDISGL